MREREQRGKRETAGGDDNAAESTPGAQVSLATGKKLSEK